MAPAPEKHRAIVSAARSRSRPLRRAVSFLAWTFALIALAGSTVWMFSAWSWQADIIANLGAQVLLLTGALALVLLILRRWKPLAIAGLACILLAIPLVQHRAAYLPKPIDPTHARAADEVRILHYNDSSASDKTAVYALIDRSGADIVEILAPPVPVQFDVIYGHGLEDKYPGKLKREWQPEPDGVNPRISAGFVLSKWPITPHDCSFLGPLSERFMAGIVERPAGRFAVVAAHPRSPRTVERWAEGNRVLDALISLTLELRSKGLPVIVLTDLNSTPSGWRNRQFCSMTGLSRAKPLLVADGTYPDMVPKALNSRQKTEIPARWPLSIAIDDALVSEGIEVTGWETEPRLQSEHRPVMIELRIPRPETSGANPDGR